MNDETSRTQDARAATLAMLALGLAATVTGLWLLFGFAWAILAAGVFLLAFGTATAWSRT